MLFLNFSADGFHDWGILLAISLELQDKVSTVFYDTAKNLRF